MRHKGAVDSDGHPIRYDRDFNGPLKRRSCTDVICLCLFVVFIACWIGIGIYAISNGNPETLTIPRDFRNLRCGYDSDVKDKPYLFFFDLTKCIDPAIPFSGCKTPQVCVKKCPSTFYHYQNKQTHLNTDFCIPSSNKPPPPDNCPRWYLPSEPFFNRCLYSLADRKSHRFGGADAPSDEISIVKRHFTSFAIGLSIFVDNTLGLFTNKEQVFQVGQKIVDDVVSSWWKILIGILMAAVAAIIYIFMMRWIAGIMVWVSIIGTIVLLGASVFFTAKKFKEFNDKNSNNDQENNNIFTNKIFWLILLITSVILLLVVLLMLIFLRNRIRLAIALIKEGSKAISSVTSVLIFPIFPWVLQIGVIAYGIIAALYLASTGDPVYQIRNANNCGGLKENGPCSPDSFNNQSCPGAICKFVYIHNEKSYPYLQAFNVVGLFWGAFFVSALGQMILASVFAQWYWTFKKSTLPFFAITEATLRVLRYHIGTLAFGSLIITICRLIRVALECIDRKLKKFDNGLVKAILCCMKCFFWCLEKFLKFINKNAYIMCAIHGKNFCASAKDAFMLLARNIIRVFVLDKVTDFLFFLSKMLVTIGIGALAYVCFATDLTTIDNSSLHYNIVPVIIIMICSYFIASIFFSVYSMAVDTLFLCFLEDCERNDGTAAKPYYMSKNLMKIFGKKNKLD